MGEQGGTKMYCPSCQEIQVCQAIHGGKVGLKGGQRWQRTDYPDIQWFRRVRQCLNCSEVFITAEIREDILEELVALRDALSDIKVNAEKYRRESAAASRTLAKLSESLSVLRALDFYKQEATPVDPSLEELFGEEDE
jgi:hypothetical protein